MKNNYSKNKNNKIVKNNKEDNINEGNMEYTNDPNIKITEKELNVILFDSEDDLHYIKKKLD